MKVWIGRQGWNLKGWDEMGRVGWGGKGGMGREEWKG